MSNVPESGPHAGMTHRSPAGGATPLGWRIKNSLWLLLPILGFTCFSGFGFLYIGLRAKRPAWWIPGILYLVVGWTAFVILGSLEPRTIAANTGAAVVLALWAGGILHACLINPSWLRWRAAQIPWHDQSGTPHSAGPSAAHPDTAPGHGVAGAPPVYGLPGRAPEYAADVPPPLPAPAQPIPPPLPPVASGPWEQVPTPAPPPATSSYLEINTATYEQLALLPGFTPERARHVLTERQARHGFGSLEEFAAAAGLTPHELEQLRHLLVCAPPWSAPPAGMPPGHFRDV